MSRKKDTPLDFTQALENAMVALRDQVEISTTAENVTLRDITIRKERTKSLIEALNNAVQISHHKELAQGNALKFKRAEELMVLNPLLRGLQYASNIAERTLEFMLEKINTELKKKDVDFKQLGEMMEVYNLGIENVTKTVSALNKTIQLERFSGGRHWGHIQDKPPSTSLLESLSGIVPKKGSGSLGRGRSAIPINEEDEEDDEPRVVRKISKRAAREIIAKQTRGRIVEDEEDEEDDEVEYEDED